MNADKIITFDALDQFDTIVVMDENYELHMIIYELAMRGGKRMEVVRSVGELQARSLPRDACVLVGQPNQAGAIDRLVSRIGQIGRVKRLIIAPCPTWFIAQLHGLKAHFPEILFVDNFKAGDSYEQQTVLSWDTYAEQARDDDVLFIPTRDPIIQKNFEVRAGHDRHLNLNRIEQDSVYERISEVKALGYAAAFDATPLHATLTLVSGETDMGRTARFAFKYLQPSHCAFDVGAHRGQLTGIFKLRCATVHAFEPEPGPLADLRSTVRHAKGVFVHGVAVSDQCGTMDFFLDHRGEFGGGSSLYLNVNSSANRIPVEVVTLEKVIAETGDRPQLIKIDVEGAEPEVVFGGIDYIKENKPVIVFELFQPVVQSRAKAYTDLMNFLKEHYDLTCLETHANPLDYFLTDRQPPMTNIGAAPKRTAART